MPTTAGNVMDLSAALLNDTQKQVYTYVAQLPYLKIALFELSELLELGSIPVVNKVSTVLTVPIGTVSVGFNTVPALPAALTEIVNVYESDQATTGFVRLTPVDFLPAHLLGTTNQNFGIFAWRDNSIKLPVALGIRYIKLEYLSSLSGNVVDENSQIGITNGESFLHYRTGGLCARFIGENNERADKLDTDAQLSIDRLTGIAIKSKQTQVVRRRPFRSGWKLSGR